MGYLSGVFCSHARLHTFTVLTQTNKRYMCASKKASTAEVNEARGKARRKMRKEREKKE